MTSRRNSDQRELLRSSQLQRIENLLDMLGLPPMGYANQESWEGYCVALGIKEGNTYPEGAYSTSREMFPGLGTMIGLPMDTIVDWVLAVVPMTPKERELFLAQQTLKLMGP